MLSFALSEQYPYFIKYKPFFDGLLAIIQHFHILNRTLEITGFL